MRILFVIPHPVEGPSSRFRVFQYVPYLEQHGVECTIRPFVSSAQVNELYRDGNLFKKIALTLGGLARRMRDIAHAGSHDAVFVLREAFALGPPFVESALARRAKAMIFDFDDAIYAPALAYRNPIDRLRDWSKTGKVIARSDTVIAGSRYLADYAARTATGKIEILPTVVDHEVYCPNPDKPKNHVTLGWIGTPRGSHYVADMMPVFKRLVSAHPQLRMVFIGCAPFDTEGLPIEFREWSLEREPADTASFDIGIMPLTDDEETRGKCGFKLIQYMSCGVAAVASPVGANNEIIEGSVSGLFASTPEQWHGALDRLIRDDRFRETLAENGRARAIAHYSLSHTAPEFLRILRETLDRATRRA
ncbi:glycosyltransferase family 4 protein [Aquicoccus sp. G2-2]|uniref:glycosyltransferase family 4 protein n=1 Tax=Aquicoccus sp. G2-2 TaxID=3092120 RepID=UPI002AE06788|nr:glycosyltransferase family 4 protein [Aquicoccus sp. G2-2]MEA1114611.1 glycosyltransferase family 4 protein [Aquicoccus sp. G2-2]